MPLYDGRPLQLLPGPLVIDDPHGHHPQGWQLRLTGEAFTDYEAYLDRLTFYRKPHFTCSLTGQPNLNYEQALLSERAAHHRSSGIGFSDMLVCEMLTFLSQSTLSISLAVDALYYRFQYDFFIGEHIDVKYPGTQGAMYECFVVGIGSMPPVLVENETVMDAAVERLGYGARRVVAYEERKQRMYSVRLYDIEGVPIADSDISVPATELGRSRNVFTKVALRQFLDDNMDRAARPGSPWIVKPEWRERFRIPYMYGGEARLLRSVGNAGGNKASRATAEQHSGNAPAAASPGSASATAVSTGSKQKTANVVVDPYAAEREFPVRGVRKFPIDDLEFQQYQHVKLNEGVVWAARRKLHGEKKPVAQITDFFPINKAKDQDRDQDQEAAAAEDQDHEGETLMKWPEPLCEWQVPVSLVSRMLSTYMFISCFGSTLGLSAYSLDYFELALVHNTQNSVFIETVLALLNTIAEDRRRNPNVYSRRIEAMIEEQDASVSDKEEEMDIDSETLPALLLGSKNAKKSGRKALLLPVVRRSTRMRQGGSALANSSVASSECGSDSDASGTETTARRPTRGGNRLAAIKQQQQQKQKQQRGGSVSVSSAPSSDNEDSANDNDDDNGNTDNTPIAVDMQALGPHALLRHLSRTWADTQTARDAWASALAGWVLEASHADYASELHALRRALWDSRSDTGGLEATLWGALDGCASRLQLLEVLVGECTSIDCVREFLEQSAEQSVELRRERVELRREAKRVAEQLDELDRADQAAVALGESREQGRKETEVGALRLKERRRLGEAERQHQKRLDAVERELRRLGVGRLVPLGCDRYLTRYFFLDGIGACPLSGACTGRVLVQPAAWPELVEHFAGQPGFVRAAWPLELPPVWSGGAAVSDFLGRADHGITSSAPQLAEPQLPLAELARAGELWGYYATTVQVDELRRWLDPRGRREAALAAELELVHMALGVSLRARCRLLEASFDARVRARESLSQRLAKAEAEEAGPEAARLAEQLAEIDRTPVPRVLLPPNILVGGSNGINDPNDANDANGTNGSSRASSMDPAAVDTDLFVQQANSLASAKRLAAAKPGRGRKPKVSRARKTIVDHFLEYENVL
ncbi:hypothetical protein BX661DRAFT_186148 [Kickxella alabastrina]|uniref:uncharacterized protein n=1 Tax=Kickxella alabastrina TaxID=61397 RepID=UPI00221E460E|nr:uncharacterized protein BX661DRAFT_186148 [Kickxella alabastrina]KAI7824029.1 hypothetical protein BX661DRAFT_186148 [Kickxella alabastrina]